MSGSARLRGLPPLEPAPGRARLLILGSMPGAASLAAARYYAHPRNRFWPTMQALFGVPVTLDYAARVERLTAQGIAVWDVLAACERPGSLDADIVRGSEQANDFATLLARHPGLRRIALNGATAAQAFRRHVQPALAGPLAAIQLHALPSTSPANAGLRDAALIDRWRVLCEAFDDAPR